MERTETPFSAAARHGRRIGHAVEVHDALPSTNDRARELLARDDGEGVVVVAELQTAGRGRRGRSWSSPAGRNLTLSVAIRPRLAASDAWQLGMAVALAAREACLPVTEIDLKWPNDLVAPNGRKVGGLLLETVIDADRVSAAVIGIGINVNWHSSEMPDEIAPTATSLGELSGASVDRGALLGRLLDHLDAELGAVDAEREPLDRYRDACATLGRAVTVEAGGRIIEGRAIAIDAAGGLVVDGPHGCETITSGEVVRVRSAVPA